MNCRALRCLPLGNTTLPLSVFCSPGPSAKRAGEMLTSAASSRSAQVSGSAVADPFACSARTSTDSLLLEVLRTTIGGCSASPIGYAWPGITCTSRISCGVSVSDRSPIGAGPGAARTVSTVKITRLLSP